AASRRRARLDGDRSAAEDRCQADAQEAGVADLEQFTAVDADAVLVSGPGGFHRVSHGRRDERLASGEADTIRANLRLAGKGPTCGALVFLPPPHRSEPEA